MSVQIITGDCLEVLRTLPDCSVDAVVTDPPYGLTKARPGGRREATRGAVMGGFMGLKWDADVPAIEVWAECLRVLKPGGHLLAFAGTRTQHRMAVRIEDAGFEIRDLIAWVYGSGFPKSHNGPWGGTALKPALEPITVARKPLVGTVEVNWRQHGTGALNIDGCRIKTDEELRAGSGGIPCRHEEATPRGRAGEASAQRRYTDSGGTNFAATPGPRGGDPSGRWPANLIHDGSEEVLAAFPQAKGQQGALTGSEPSSKTANAYGEFAARAASDPRGDTGSAARFFYCAKASKADRGANNHSTVKPTDLMRYLCRLVTPHGGAVLDPFMGSGSTGKAAVLEGFRFIGIEREAEYAEIARARIAAAQAGAEKAAESSRQPDLFGSAA